MKIKNKSKKSSMEFPSTGGATSSEIWVACMYLERNVQNGFRQQGSFGGNESTSWELQEKQMRRLSAATLVAMLACLVAGVAFADDVENDVYALPTDKLDKDYGNLVAPGVPDNIGPDDHNNTHRGDNGWHADPDGVHSLVKLPDPILLFFILWIL